MISVYPGDQSWGAWRNDGENVGGGRGVLPAAGGGEDEALFRRSGEDGEVIYQL